MLPKKTGYIKSLFLNFFLGFASTIGNAKDFSEIDLAKINRMYKCEHRINSPTIYSTNIAAKAQVAPIYAPNYSKGDYSRPQLTGHTFYNNVEKLRTSYFFKFYKKNIRK